MILHPVVVSLPTDLRGREAVDRQREAARAALLASADRGGMPPALPRQFDHDAAGAPVPTVGWHHATANTQGMAAALVAPVPVAVDVEWLGRPRVGAARTSATPEELALLDDDEASVLRLWTAKEAVLKLAGVGLARLSECRLVDRHGDVHFLMAFGKSKHKVALQREGDHVLAVAAAEEPFDVSVSTLEATDG